ncbi:zinc finger protein 239-like isoform X2 [Oreochromis aureus]|uniref:C2H2-type domain-containing protein n=1 Tax=Oreochromis aureus TaxID=47969 RepID=A0AAZ1XGJ8_OREAU|nr:zinc finger protein 239-like isoform X2 [Oreochromis aureus]
MGTLHHLNALITERLTAAAVEIFGAVEKTLIDYQGEISRSKQEINQLRSLLSWPEVRLHRSDHLLSPCSDEEASPEGCTPHVHPKPQSILHIKEEHDQRDAQQGASCRQQRDATVSPEVVTKGDHEDPPSHLYTVLTVEQAAAIKAEPHGDECLTSTCRINAESEVQQLNPEDPLEITYSKNHGTQQDQSQYQHCYNRHTSQIIKVQAFTSSRPQEEVDCDCTLHHQPVDDYDEAPSLTPSPKCSLSNNTFTTAENRTDVEGCTLSRESQSVHSVEPEQLVGQSEHTENIESVGIKLLKPSGTRQQKRRIPELNTNDGDGIGMEEDGTHFIRERRHTCPICAKRFKESSHLKDHVRIHTGEKPYRCKECGVNFRQSGALTLHMRIHTGERPYQCTECGRRFNRKGDMETHRVTHTGERPHSCLFCGKTFQRKSQLNTHLKIHEEDRTDYTHPL